MKDVILFLQNNPLLIYITILLFILCLIFVIVKRKWIFKMYKKYEEIILYLIAGFLTTVISILSYALFVFLLNPFLDKMISITVANILSWIIAVTFAFFVNKIFVFKSKTKGKDLLNESIEFVKYRIVSLLVDIFCMWLFVSLFKMNDILAKIIDQVIIVIINYIFSKFIIFTKKD